MKRRTFGIWVHDRVSKGALVQHCNATPKLAGDAVLLQPKQGDSSRQTTPLSMAHRSLSPHWVKHLGGLRKLWVALVPIGLRLKNSRGLYHLRIPQRTPNKLYARGQAIVIKTARHADRGQPANIADPANRIGKGEGLVQVRVQPGGSHGKRRRNQEVYFSIYLVHFLLQDSADSFRSHEIRGADGLIHVTANPAQGIAQLGNPPGLNQVAKSCSPFHGNNGPGGYLPRPFRQADGAELERRTLFQDFPRSTGVIV